jgi:hypothetical protein
LLQIDGICSSVRHFFSAQFSRVMMLIHRLESLSTQLQAFISIVILTTRYPRLQRLFGTCGYIQRVGNSHNTISSLWMRVDGCDQESLFCLKYAAFRVSDNFIAIQMERSTRSDWVMCTRGNSVLSKDSCCAAGS